jgi:hypothetical protein
MFEVMQNIDKMIWNSTQEPNKKIQDFVTMIQSFRLSMKIKMLFIYDVCQKTGLVQN